MIPTIKIFVKFFASLAERVGDRETIVSLKDESSIQDLLDKLKLKYGEEFQAIFQSNGNLKETHKILLNENNLPDQNFVEIKLKNRDIIAFVPPVGGGCEL